MKKLVYLLVFSLCLSCNNNEIDCSAVTCITPSITVDFVDNDSKENFIHLNNITEENISIQNSSLNDLEFYINENTGILTIGKQNNSDTIDITILPDTIISISYDTTSPKPDDCCDFGELVNIQITDKSFEIIEGVITVYL